jgi:NitT/TauT family transport system substrate-binding protein
LRHLARSAAALAVLAAAAPACAQTEVRIGVGFGLSFLPVYICEDLKLIEKQGRAAHLDVAATYQRFYAAGTLQEAIAAGAIDMGPFGTAPLLTAWDTAKDPSRQILAVSGITTLPLALLSNRPDIRSLADIGPADRIAVPTVSSPQAYLLEIASEKTLGAFDKLRSRITVLSHPEALAALFDGDQAVAAYFASPPFTQLALRDGRVHEVLSSATVIGGKASFLIMGAARGYVEAHPQIAELVGKAIDEAARIIRAEPRRAAQIYLTHEPSKSLDAATVEAVLRQDKDEFGSAVYGVQAFADFMARHGQLKTPPQSWKNLVAPALLGSPST